MVTAPSTSATRNPSTAQTLTVRSSRSVATSTITAPTTTSTACQSSNRRALTSSWPSAGLVSTKSSVPCCTSVMSCCMFGCTTDRMTPPMSTYTPMTTSSSSPDQPPRESVWPNTSASTASAVATATSDCSRLKATFARYCSSACTPTRRNVPTSRSPRASRAAISCRRPSVTDGGVPPHAEPEHQAGEHGADDDPQQLHRHSGPQRLGAEVADQGLDREAERGGERTPPGDPLRPRRQQRQRHQPAGQQQLGGEEQLVERGDPGRPEADHPQRLEQQRADQVGAPDRDQEDDHLLGADRQRRPEHQRQHDGDRQPEHDRDDLPAGEVGEVVVQRVHRAQQLPGE